jgi:HlyD family secretion protein
MPIQASGAADLNRYRLGMNGDASIILNQKDDVLAVPVSAIREKNGQTFVKVKTGPNSATDREIKTGLETDTQIEVTSGLNQGDEVVVP